MSILETKLEATASTKVQEANSDVLTFLERSIILNFLTSILSGPIAHIICRSNFGAFECLNLSADWLYAGLHNDTTFS